MKHLILLAGMLAAMPILGADSKGIEVTVYVTGDTQPPGSVEFAARATVTGMYGRIGVRLAWRDGRPKGRDSASPVAIEVRFVRRFQPDATREALALALPFDERRPVIDVMYDRISRIANRSTLAQTVLAHVLAHEIGHVLQRTNRHAQTGVMKAHWSGQDYDAMTRQPLEFSAIDVELIREGLEKLKAGTARP